MGESPRLPARPGDLLDEGRPAHCGMSGSIWRGQHPQSSPSARSPGIANGVPHGLGPNEMIAGGGSASLRLLGVGSAGDMLTPGGPYSELTASCCLQILPEGSVRTR